jgi:hypothetical protein
MGPPFSLFLRILMFRYNILDTLEEVNIVVKNQQTDFFT